ncbi:hypothetical protein vseg_010396 [Gypsophila vaccaria]
MDSEGGGIVAAAAPMTPRRLSSQHSTLRDSFIASDIAEGLNRASTVNNNNSLRSQQPVSNVTLGAVLNEDKKSPPSSNVVVRTLLEVIRNDESLNIGGGSPNRRKSWKTFKEKLRRRNAQNPNSRRRASPMRAPQSDVLPSSRSERDLMSNRNSLSDSLRNNSIRRADTYPNDDGSLMEVDGGGSSRTGGSFRLSAALAAEREQTRIRLSRELDEDGIDVPGLSAQENAHEGVEEDGETVPVFGDPANQPVRMSLMDLLEETDRQAGISGTTYRLGDEEEEDEEAQEEEVVDEELVKSEFSCCVCMVRHKGAAFIPCGHTFCRLCSRELFVQRGNCPLCNNFILEILNIF